MLNKNSINFYRSYENGRITLNQTDLRTCSLHIANLTLKDEGIWTMTLDSGAKKERPLMEYKHEVSIEPSGKLISKSYGHYMNLIIYEQLYVSRRNDCFSFYCSKNYRIP